MLRPAPSFIERRSEPRVAVNAPARLLYGAKLSLWADCTIRDLSTNGAKIELSHLHVAPPRFVLLHFEAGVAYDAMLIATFERPEAFVEILIEHGVDEGRLITLRPLESSTGRSVSRRPARVPAREQREEL